MSINIESLVIELKNIFRFWETYIINDLEILSEVDAEGTANTNAELGSMFLARALYGASVACKTLNTHNYTRLAETAYHKLITDFKNPNGGYYWAKDVKNKHVHDIDNNNLAQAFVLYGLAEYASYKKENTVQLMLDEQINFIINTINDRLHDGFIDGFDKNWNPLEKQNKALGTHLHLLEAFEKVYLLNKSELIKSEIEKLITIITEKFIDSETLHCWHRLTLNWQPLPNEIWAGHDVEVSWILCKAAKTIENKALINACNELALKTVDNTLKLASDKQKGGMFNVLENGEPNENVKIWWPQAEMVIGLLNCFEISNNEHYLKLAGDFSTYISKYLVSDKGEWFTELTLDNKPVVSTPMVFFWKSLYHNVRYYAEVIERINKLNNNNLSSNSILKKRGFSQII